jgi:hypothetical protein
MFVACVCMWPNGLRAAHTLRHAHGVPLPLRAAAAAVRALQHAALVPRRERPVPAVRAPREQAVRVREAGDAERALLARDGEGVLRDRLRPPDGVRVPPLRAPLPRRRLRAVRSAVWQGAEILVCLFLDALLMINGS